MKKIMIVNKIMKNKIFSKKGQSKILWKMIILFKTFKIKKIMIKRINYLKRLKLLIKIK